MKRCGKQVLLAGMLVAVLAIGAPRSASAQGWSFSISSGYPGGFYGGHGHRHCGPPAFVPPPPPPPCHVYPYPSVYRYRAYYGPYGGIGAYGGYGGFYRPGYGW
ncbi:MAG: hypothetical protein K1X74_04410 [Pirellulales bacterium]|nr:hypothetical protein [Pirellulales bacterium]